MSTVVSDQIMAIGQYRKARVLVRDDNTLAIFTTVSTPTRTLHFTARTRRGFTLDDGSTLRTRPVGSSCSWPLARCRQSTAQLEALWTS